MIIINNDIVMNPITFAYIGKRGGFVNLERLRVFRTIVEEGSFRRAAERLFLSQPSVSQNIAALEREYDVRLFERKGRTIALTLEGRALHVLASDLLRKADDIPLRFREMQMLKYGKLAIRRRTQ